MPSHAKRPQPSARTTSLATSPNDDCRALASGGSNDPSGMLSPNSGWPASGGPGGTLPHGNYVRVTAAHPGNCICKGPGSRPQDGGERLADVAHAIGLAHDAIHAGGE